MKSWWDWFTDFIGDFHFRHRKDRFAKKHNRSGYTKRPLEMRKADNRRKNKAARQARKQNRPHYTQIGK